MAKPNLSPIFISLSALGFYLLWIVMGLNGALEAVFDTIGSGTFPNGRPLKMTYTGILPLDRMLLILVVFFDGLTNLVDTVPYLMLLDLVSTLHVINMMTLVENRRKERSGWLRFPALWHYMWNCAGVAVFLPIFSLFYVKQGPKSISRLPDAEAQALPATALWSLLLPIPLMLPGLVGATPFRIQEGVILFFLTPPIFVVFQALTSAIVSRTHYRSSRNPVKLAYSIVGFASAIVHVGIALYAVSSLAADTTWSRIYIPHNSAVRRGDPNIITEGALLFIQYDFIIINVVVLILGTYILQYEPNFLAKSTEDSTRCSGSVITLIITTIILGPGAGLAYAMRCKEQSQILAEARSKPMATSNSDEVEIEEGEIESIVWHDEEAIEDNASTSRPLHLGDFYSFA